MYRNSSKDKGKSQGNMKMIKKFRLRRTKIVKNLDFWLDADFFYLYRKVKKLHCSEYSAISVVALGGLVKTFVWRMLDGGLPYYSLSVSQVRG